MKIEWINNAFLALCLQIFTMIFIGDGIISSTIIYLIDGRFLGVFCDSNFDPCGNPFEIIASVIYRSFAPGWQIVSAPIVVLFTVSWIYVCVLRGRFLLQMTTQERRRCVRSTYIVPAIFLFVALVKVPSDFLFSGPIFGFHPLSPLLRAVLSILVPMLFWRFTDSMFPERR